uniref:Uncharacterized protein n=1 Tax=Romanomermis culicivorax TaxID=13658 RepID=A0A915HR96_ROMCU
MPDGTVGVKSPFCPLDLCQTTRGFLTSLNQPRVFAACLPQRRYCGYCPKNTEFNADTSECVPSTKSSVANGFPDCPVQLCGNDMGGGMYRFSKSPYTFLVCSRKVKFCVACPQNMEMDYKNLTCVAAQKLITTPDLIGAVITKFEILDEISDMHTVAHLAPSDLQASACTDCPIDRCFGFYGIYVLPDSSDSPTIIVCSKTKRFCAKCPKNSKFDLMKKKCIKSSTNSRDCKIHRSCIMERELVNNSTQGHTLLINEGGGNRFQICNNKGASMCGFCPKGTKFDLRSLNCVRKFSKLLLIFEFYVELA